MATVDYETRMIENILERVKGELEQRGETGAWLAKQCSVAPNTIYRVMRGEMKPSIELIESMFDALELEIRVVSKSNVNAG